MEAQTETTTGPPRRLSVLQGALADVGVLVDATKSPARRLSVLQGFVPLVEVYSGATPMFESEGAARWFIR